MHVRKKKSYKLEIRKHLTMKAVFLQLYTCKHRSWLESYENKYQGFGFHRISLVPI